MYSLVFNWTPISNVCWWALLKLASLAAHCRHYPIGQSFYVENQPSIWNTWINACSLFVCPFRGSYTETRNLNDNISLYSTNKLSAIRKGMTKMLLRFLQIYFRSNYIFFPCWFFLNQRITPWKPNERKWKAAALKSSVITLDINKCISFIKL